MGTLCATAILLIFRNQQPDRALTLLALRAPFPLHVALIRALLGRIRSGLSRAMRLLRMWIRRWRVLPEATTAVVNLNVVLLTQLSNISSRELHFRSSYQIHFSRDGKRFLSP